MTTTTLPESIPANIQQQLDDIQRLRQSFPALFREGVTLFLGESGLTLTWPFHAVTEAEIHALALSYPDAGWKPKLGSQNRELDWVGTVGGVKVRLPRAESVPIEVLPERVDLSKLAAKGGA